MKDPKNVSASVKADRARVKRNKKAGLQKISPTHWVKAEHKQAALDAVRKAVKKYK